MKKTDVLIIGGSAAGLAVAVSGKNRYPEKDFLLVRKEEKVMIPCGIPYIFGSLDSSDQNVLPADATYEKQGIHYQVGEVTEIDTAQKKVVLADGEIIGYDKLVIATGSLPKVPKWLNGSDLENVFTIPKSKVYLDKMSASLKDKKNIVVVGGGFIGVETADELNKNNHNVTIVERLPHILTLAFDEELAVKAEDILKARGVKLVTGKGIRELKGDKAVEKVILEDGTEMEADAVVLSVGYKPNTSLAARAGLSINAEGFIKVDEYMRTGVPDVMAVGDCAEKHHFVTRKTTGVMLASTACAEGRTAGMNLFNLHAVKTFSGTISIYSTAIGDYAFGTAGLTEAEAKAEGFKVVTGIFEGMDRHPGKLPGMHPQVVKLIVARESGVVIGGEAIGGSSVGELTNLLGFIIQSRTHVHTIQTAQIGTQPMLTASPAAYPLINAANQAAAKMRK
jgi:NADPH-dependent 2,4-dienoyl-CoA reductase/sulfur reductase-like enzyme